MNVQWGTFTSNASSASDSLSEAENAMRGQGYTVYLPVGSNEYTVIGGDATVIVQATVVPQGGSNQFVIVTAYADDEPVAELARNVIRSGIR